LGLFFTTALMTLLVEDIAFQNIYKESYGVVEEESIMFFFSAFLVPLIWIINPWHILNVIKRRLFKDRTDYTQR
jgi:Mg2+/Co2+ transporter CorB